jgi:putative toxin-antitoxin system antitoxin component (TIGR02293 family)
MATQARSEKYIVGREFLRPLNLLGGREIVHAQIQSDLDVHEVIARGLPRTALNFLVSRTSMLRNQEYLRKAVGVSTRTTQRHKSAPDALLSEEQSGRTWKFAEILGKATEVLGSQEEAEHWLASPAIGLNQHCPINLLSTPKGTELVENLLTQMEYGVYA